jgi:hypothetical protein
MDLEDDKQMSASQGRCSCGAVTYALAAAPLFVHACHCRDCQRHTGSAFVINAMVLSADLQVITGEIAPWPAPAAKGAKHFIHRCAQCQSAVWSSYGGKKTAMVYLRVATLDRPEELPPSAHIFTRSKLPWVDLPKNVPAYKTWYDREKTWPPESLARRKAAAART